MGKKMENLEKLILKKIDDMKEKNVII